MTKMCFYDRTNYTIFIFNILKLFNNFSKFMRDETNLKTLKKMLKKMSILSIILHNIDDVLDDDLH